MPSQINRKTDPEAWLAARHQDITSTEIAALFGLSPYINASIIVQLCTVIFPKLEALSKEGQQGQQQLNRYMRWLSLPLAFIQSYGFLVLLDRGGPLSLTFSSATCESSSVQLAVGEIVRGSASFTVK